ncbi:N-acetylmuramoyl-L-alanine amidase [Robertmurraya sp. FSL W8-0741]|uniref:N-acetylmuramoyl-L-alanine amidase n=1 Tax=Robertmurraya sp. FSL W8-0741 TaxID=2954629 RepID=UPI0030FAF89B
MLKIFIDPGHGGTDPGSMANGLLEKYLTLAISLKIKSLLSQYENVQVKLSRETDKYLSLSARAKLANAWGADYFMSIHINAGGGTGFETFVHTNASNASVANQNEIHTEILKPLDFKDRGKKRANYAVLRETNMPAILTENGFIDNASDAAKLKQTDFIDKIAQGHVNGLVKALGLKKVKSGIAEPKPEKEDEVNWLMEPVKFSVKEMENALLRVLGRFEQKDPALGKEWRTKFINGELTGADALGILYVAVDRGYITGKSE